MDGTPLPDLVLYGRPGCRLCDETRIALDEIVAERTRAGRPSPRVVERDITSDVELTMALGHRIPVVELGDRRVELVTSVGRLRRLIEGVYG